MEQIRQLLELCREIAMPEPVTEQLATIAQNLDFSPLVPEMGRLFAQETWEDGLSRLKTGLGEDPLGLKMLTCQLLCALKTRESYAEQGMGDDIFLATMGCFSRFAQEYRESYGEYGFDREWWTVRQLSGRLFRVGLLEYELRDGYVSLHIPTGARLYPEAVDASLEAGHRFLTRYFPAWADCPMKCHSWLLSPTLKGLLREDSNILQFQHRFTIEPEGCENREYLLWIFKRMDLPLDALPEDTPLQRALKAHLLRGGTFQDARGTLHK